HEGARHLSRSHGGTEKQGRTESNRLIWAVEGCRPARVAGLVDVRERPDANRRAYHQRLASRLSRTSSRHGGVGSPSVRLRFSVPPFVNPLPPPPPSRAT